MNTQKQHRKGERKSKEDKKLGMRTCNTGKWKEKAKKLKARNENSQQRKRERKSKEGKG